MSVAEWCLWLSLVLLAWTYLLYPLSVWVISLIHPRPWEEKEFKGRVTLLVAAYNEEDVIGEKIENCLNLNFGPASGEVIIVSDGSTDRTESILQEYQEKVKIVTYRQRTGKANALNIGAGKSSGEILIFSDANVIIEPDACVALLKPFYDKMVGSVCGKVLIKPKGQGEVAGESLYMKYEGWIQRSESRLHTMVGIDGAFFALRKELFSPLPPGMILDDFALSMEAPLSGKRIVYAKEAIAVEEVVSSAENEFKRKVRIVAGGWQYLSHFFHMKKKLKGVVWFEFFSHKILRWVSPFLMLLLFLFNFILTGPFFYNVLLILQIFFYSLAFLGQCLKKLRKFPPVYMPYYFCIVNMAALIGFVYFVFGNLEVKWQKVSR